MPQRDRARILRCWHTLLMTCGEMVWTPVTRPWFTATECSDYRLSNLPNYPGGPHDSSASVTDEQSTSSVAANRVLLSTPTLPIVDGSGYRLAVATEGGDTNEPSRTIRPWADRPHWWGVLAVLLGLMALIFALTDSSSHPNSLMSPSTSTARPTSGFNGFLDLPALRSESFWRSVPAAGTELALLRDPEQVSMRLTVACPGDRRTTIGTRRVRLRMGSGQGSCLVTVSSSSKDPGIVRYHVSLHRVGP